MKNWFIKFMTIIGLLFINIQLKAQLLPACEAKFSTAELWEPKNNEIFGKRLKEETTQLWARVENIVKQDGTYSYIYIGGVYYGGGQSGFIVKSVQLQFNPNEATAIGQDISYKARCSDAHNKEITILLRYLERKLTELTIILENEGCLRFKN